MSTALFLLKSVLFIMTLILTLLTNLKKKLIDLGIPYQS